MKSIVFDVPKKESDVYITSLSLSPDENKIVFVGRNKSKADNN